MDSDIGSLAGIVPSGLQAASLTPMNKIVAANLTQVEISITLNNPLNPNSLIFIHLPLWNPSDGVTAQH
jgi:hypothetical protein